MMAFSPTALSLSELMKPGQQYLSAANTTENSASGMFNDKFTAGSSIEIQGITATYGRMVVPLTSRGEAVTLINETQNDGSTLVTGMAGGRRSSV